MALIQTAGLPQSLRAHHMIPSRTRVVMRCLEESCGKAKSNPLKTQITRELEIVYPETLMLNGEPVVIAGIKMKHYRGIRLDNADGTRNETESNILLGRYRDELKSLEMPYEAIDDETPELLTKGMYLDVNIGSEEYERTAPLTAEEKAAGVKQGKPTGEKGYKPKIEFILGKAAPVDGQVW
jgi:hypothetical protein